MEKRNPGSVATFFDGAKKGVIFIDEAYDLNPSSNLSGQPIASELLLRTENDRTTTTFIMAGYEDDIKKKLMNYNDGFTRRFPIVFRFEDYTENELQSIFEGIAEHYDWKLQSPKVSVVAARRIARGRGFRGFGNAGTVRNLFEKARGLAILRPNHNLTLTMEDVLGFRPDPDTNKKIAESLKQLDAMVGLDDIKKQARDLIAMLQVNYDNEIQGRKVTPPVMNRVFAGNPGL
jgi:hypothetical protein